VGVTALPADMQTALAQGRLTAADARAWVGISKSVLLCKLATAMPSVRDKLVGAPSSVGLLPLPLRTKPDVARSWESGV